MDYEYVESNKFNSPKIRLVSDKNNHLFIRKNVRVDSLLAEKLTGISSPYIVKFIEFGEDNDGAYVIEEYVEGVTAAEQTFTRKQSVKILLELCDALGTLHSAKIVHRDIKPSNIIITKDGHIKLIDFDASRIEKAVKDKDTQILGTEGFAPPEQFGFSQTDSRSDIYSFGVTMNLLLGDNSAPFNNIIKKCKALDPNDRYDDISAVKTAIRLAALKKFMPIPAAALLLIVFTTFFAAALENRDITEHTGVYYSESYINSDTTQPLPVDLQTSTDSSSGEIDSDSLSTSSEISSEPETSTSQKSSSYTQNSETSTPQESSQSSQTSEPPQTSETSNGFYKTVMNENGYFNDVCDYYFNDDPAVHGVWDVIGAIKKENLDDFLGGRIDLIYGGAKSEEIDDPGSAWIKKIRLNWDGSASISDTFPAKWTKGYVVLDYTDRNYVCELFSVTVNDIEYLLIEKKTGDYATSGVSDDYFVYIRESVFGQIEEHPPKINPVTGTYKITYTTSFDNDRYEDKCDYYFFYDDPSVHGYWEVCGLIYANQYNDWIAGIAKPYTISDTWLKKINIYPEGDAIIGYSANEKWNAKWSNGYMVDINLKSVSALFTVTVGGKEYLVIENKDGDYERTGNINTYFICSKSN